MKDEKKDFVKVLEEMSDIIDRQIVGVASYVRQLDSFVKKMATDINATEKDADIAAAATHLVMRLNHHKFNTKALSLISRELERFVHDYTDECIEIMDTSED